MEMSQYNYTCAMADYLSCSMSKNAGAVRDEFIHYIKNTIENKLLLSTLISLGDSQCLQAYIDTHGTEQVEIFVSSISPKKSLVSILGHIDSDEFFNSLKIIHSIQNNLADRETNTHAIMMKAKVYHDPSVISNCMKVMGIEVSDIRSFLLKNSFIEDADASMQAWFINFMKMYVTPESVDEREWNEHIEKVLKKDGVKTIAFYIKSGFNMLSAINCQFTQKQTSNSWFVRLARRMSSSHDFVQMYAKLPEVERIFSMDKTELTHLMAGKSRKEMKRERKRKVAEDYNATALNRLPA